MFKMSDGFVQFTEINDKDECDNQKNAESKKLKHHKAEKWGEQKYKKKNLVNVKKC